MNTSVKMRVSLLARVQASLLFGLVMIALIWVTQMKAQQPHISYVDLTPVYITIHFETDGDRTYVLQYTDRFPTTGSVTWSNLKVFPQFPPNHYVWADYRTNKQRFYRLQVIP